MEKKKCMGWLGALLLCSRRAAADLGSATGRSTFHVLFRGEDKNWPTSGQIAYRNPAVWGVPNASEQGIQSAAAHQWARGLHNPYHVRGSQTFRGGDTINSGPETGPLATAPLIHRGSRSRGKNQKWPAMAQIDNINPTIWG